MSAEPSEAGDRGVEEHGPQPQIEMDLALKATLAEARRRAPRFLFRGWSNAKNEPRGRCPDRGGTRIGPSGGRKDLNTTSAVTPLAYHERHASSVHSILEQGEAALRDMIITHLTVRSPWANKPPTQFSSWGASLAVAVSFARGSDPHIGVIDTKMLPNNSFVAHVPALDFVRDHCLTYDWEYLVHGVVDGDCYKAIPLASFSDIGFPFDPAWAAEPLLPITSMAHCPLPSQSNLEVTQRCKDALGVAKQYGTHFILPIMLGVVCQKFKNADYRTDHKRLRKDVESIVGFVDRLRLHVPSNWVHEPSIMEDHVVDSENYMDVRMMLMCMRLLVVDRYPVVTRKHGPGLSRERILREARVSDKVGAVKWGAGAVAAEIDAINRARDAVETGGDAKYDETCTVADLVRAVDPEWDGRNVEGGEAEIGWDTAEHERDAMSDETDAMKHEGSAMGDESGAAEHGWDAAECGWDTTADQATAMADEAIAAEYEEGVTEVGWDATNDGTGVIGWGGSW